MAAVVVTFDGVRLTGAEDPDDGGVWDKFGANQDPTQETDFLLQGAVEQSNKISNNTGGVEFLPTSSVNFSGTPKAIIAKILLTTTGVIDLTEPDALAYYIGSDGDEDANFNRYDIFGIKGSYPIDRSWIPLVIDPNIPAYADVINGTAVLTVIDCFSTRQR